jgi:hypothetical protein
MRRLVSRSGDAETPNNETNTMKEYEDMMRGQMKSMAKKMLPFWIICGLVNLSALGGVIWFIFWCANHFFGK